MVNFNISIELRGLAEEAAEDYRRLRDRMGEAGFRHSIRDEAGAQLRLPRDEFTFAGYFSCEEVLDIVYKIVSEFIPAPGVMVTKSAGRAWRGLEKIDLS
jgi:hypothetical protein